MNKTITQQSRERKENHITVIAEVETDDDSAIIAKEVRKVLRRTKHLLRKETSFLLVINQGNNHSEEPWNQSSHFQNH